MLEWIVQFFRNYSFRRKEHTWKITGDNLHSIRIRDDYLLQNLRKDQVLLWKLQRIDTDVIRAGILRESGREAMVGTI